MEKNFSPVAQTICELCGFVWVVLVMGATAYVVFGLERSGWWFALAVFLASGWSCKRLGSPEQIRANAERDRAEQ